MAYGNMTPAVSGQPASAAANNQIITNVEDLDTRLDTVEARTTNASTGNTQLGSRVTAVENTVNASGTTASGNAALSARLGTGVTSTAGSTATDKFNSQGADITSLKSRSTALETLTGDATKGNDALNTRVTAVEGATGVSPLPIVRVQRTTNQDIANNPGSLDAWTLISWSSTTRDAHTMWSSGNPTYVTVPSGQTGLYFVSANCKFHNVANSTPRNIAIRVMDSSGATVNFYRAESKTSVSGNYCEMQAVMTLELTAGQRVAVALYQNSGATVAINTSEAPAVMTVQRIA